MEEHPLLGYEMLRDVTFLQGEGLAVVRSHHERWDGRGYPDGLEGTEIPLAGADLRRRRHARRDDERPALPPAASLGGGGRGDRLAVRSQFDPRVVDRVPRERAAAAGGAAQPRSLGTEAVELSPRVNEERGCPKRRARG